MAGTEQKRLTEDDLRQMMRDRRYWQTSHPEHREFFAMVQEGYRHLYDGAPDAPSEKADSDEDKPRHIEGNDCPAGSQKVYTSLFIPGTSLNFKVKKCEEISPFPAGGGIRG